MRHKGRIREEVRIDRAGVVRVICTVPAARLPQMRTMYRGPNGNHILMYHSASEGITSCD